MSWWNFGRSPREQAAAEQRRLREKQKRQQEEQRREASREQARQHAVMAAQRSQQATRDGHARLLDHEIRYATAIVLLGYGGFFALWATTSGNMPKQLFGWAGVLISISLLTFVLFEVAKIAATSFAVRRGEKDGLSHHATIEKCNEYLDKVQRYWITIFLCSLTTGLAAGGIVVWAFVQHALGNAWS